MFGDINFCQTYPYIDINGNFLVEGTKRNTKMNTVVAADEAVRYLTSLMVEVQKLAVTLI